MMNARWGSEFPTDVKKTHIVGNVANLHMELFNTLELPYSKQVEKYVYEAYFPTDVGSADIGFILDAATWDSANGNILVPLSYFWLADELYPCYMAHQSVNSWASDMNGWLEETLARFNNALDELTECFLNPVTSPKVKQYLEAVVHPALLDRIQEIEATVAQLKAPDSNVMPFVAGYTPDPSEVGNIA